jgi:hypothetical protein
MINEYDAGCGMRIEGENEVLGEKALQCRTEVYKNNFCIRYVLTAFILGIIFIAQYK